MMYIRQVQILVQAQICTWLIVYTKRGAASSFCSTSRVLFSILFLQILFPAFRQIFCRAAEHIPYQLFHLFSGSSSFHLRILQECFHHQIKITQNSCFQNPLMVCHMGIHQLLDPCSGSSPAYNGRMASLSNTALVSTTALSGRLAI